MVDTPNSLLINPPIGPGRYRVAGLQCQALRRYAQKSAFGNYGVIEASNLEAGCAKIH